MSIHRFAARRDANEPEIRKRFAHHGWHTEQVSGAGLPDLIVFLPEAMAASRPGFLVDVKDGNGTPTKAQVSKWTALRAKGIPVYVVRTEADVDALVAGTLEPWGPEVDLGTRVAMKGALRASLARKGDAAKARPGRRSRQVEFNQAMDALVPSRRAAPNYTPPRSTPVDADKEAEVFAPPPCPCGDSMCADCAGAR